LIAHLRWEVLDRAESQFTAGLQLASNDMLRLDTGSVRFLEAADLERLSRIALLQPYLERKRREVEDTNTTLVQRLGDLAQQPANRRRLTNLGTFRAYADAYLRQRPGIHRGMTLMVRAMEPSAEGVPMELYCFTNTTQWVAYEGIQSDLFDHLLAILPEFGLRLYQRPAGGDLQHVLGAAVVGAAADIGEGRARP
jgi:miniconductance mechanosensitive channel